MTGDVKKRGLGRGLDALFRDVKTEEQSFQQAKPAAPAAPVEAKIRRADEMVAAAVTVQQQAPAASSASAPAAGQRKVAVEKLFPGKYQPRQHFDDAALQQLADSIAVHGVLQPLLVRPLSGGKFEIIAGERRWRAAQKAQVHEIPVMVQELTDKQALEIALIENLQREDLSAIEEAEGYQRLMDEFGHTQDALSQQLGKSRSHVANTLRLLKLPASVRQMVQGGKLTAGHARTLVGAKNPEEIAAAIVKRNLSVRQAEKLVQGVTEKKTRLTKIKGFVQKDVDILALEQKVTTQLGLKVVVESANNAKNPGAGRLMIEYKSLEQLDDVIKRLLGAKRV
jgi:ParB family chromosome partitioning protein